jgi:hypothetical protein
VSLYTVKALQADRIEIRDFLYIICYPTLSTIADKGEKSLVKVLALQIIDT